MLPRTLEPEIMDTAEEASDYDAMDHASVNARFVDDLLAQVSSLTGRDLLDWPTCRLLDAGTGTALIPLELIGRGFSGTIVAVDAAAEMLKVARERVAEADAGDQIELVQQDCKALAFPDASFDLVMSNSIVHHIPEPPLVFSEAWRVLKPGGILFMRDLLRPDSAETVERLVTLYAGNEPLHSRQLFRQSLHAALTIEEVEQSLAGIAERPELLAPTSDRHWTLVCRRPD